MAYSLPPPRLTCKAVPRHERKGEALSELLRHEGRCTLVALVGILLEHGCVVLLRVVTAFEDDRNELSQLAQSVAGVMYVRLRLTIVSIYRINGSS